jgi:hypothetical protein
MSFKLKPTALEKLANKRRRSAGFPIATVAFYGPNDQRASKVAVAIVPHEGAEPAALERWFSDADARQDPRLAREIVAFIERHGVRRIAMADRIIGCPHEEGTDYPEGESCPMCPFWQGRDRWTHRIVH